MNHRPLIARTLLAALIGVVALSLPGCPPAPRPLEGSGMDMFGPIAMRIHPLTRVVANPAQIEARIEFTDQMSDVTKAVGVLQFELSRDEFAHTGRVAAWRVDLSTPAENKKNWDAITRTYLCKLKLDGPAVLESGRKYLLSAKMVFPNNSTLDSDFKITIP